MRCLVCGSVTDGYECERCGFDLSLCREEYLSLSPAPDGYVSLPEFRERAFLRSESALRDAASAGAETEELRAQIIAMRETERALVAERDGLSGELNKCRSEAEKLLADRDAGAEEIEKLKAQCAGYTEEIDNLKKQAALMERQVALLKEKEAILKEREAIIAELKETDRAPKRFKFRKSDTVKEFTLSPGRPSSPSAMEGFKVYPGPFEDIKEGECMIAGSTWEPAGALILPVRVGKMTVSAIAERAFEDCKRITSVVIPPSVRRIESYAFGGCFQLRRVDLPYCSELQSRAFYGCGNLIEVRYPVEYPPKSGLPDGPVAPDAFLGCSKELRIFASLGSLAAKGSSVEKPRGGDPGNTPTEPVVKRASGGAWKHAGEL